VLPINVKPSFGPKACVATFLITCSNDETTLTSPDKRHLAHRLVRYREGPMAFNVNITQTIELRSADGRTKAKIFESDEDGGSMRWDDDAQLAIAVDAISSITSSEHQAEAMTASATSVLGEGRSSRNYNRDSLFGS
jgi:hypothetical protein